MSTLAMAASGSLGDHTLKALYPSALFPSPASSFPFPPAHKDPHRNLGQLYLLSLSLQHSNPVRSHVVATSHVGLLPTEMWLM